MKNILKKLNAPLPGWLTVLLLALGFSGVSWATTSLVIGNLTTTNNVLFKNVASGGVQVRPASDNTTAVFQVTNAAVSSALFRIDDTSSTSAAAFVQKGGTLGQLIPAYTSSGAQVGGALHAAFATCSIGTGTDPFCNITLSNNAVFTSATSYSCSVTDTDPVDWSAIIPANVSQTSGSALKVTLAGTTSSSSTAALSCLGT